MSPDLKIYIQRQKPLADQTLEGKVGWKPLRLLRSFIGNLVEGIRHIGVSRFLYLAAGASFCSFVFQVLAFWLVMWGYGLHLSFWAGAAVLLIIHLGIAIPNAPGNVGMYQFFCVLGLMIFGVDKTLATGFSVVVFLSLRRRYGSSDSSRSAAVAPRWRPSAAGWSEWGCLGKRHTPRINRLSNSRGGDMKIPARRYWIPGIVSSRAKSFVKYIPR